RDLLGLGQVLLGLGEVLREVRVVDATAQSEGQTEVCLVGVRTKSKGSAIGLLSFPVTAEGEVHRCVVHLRLEELRVQLNCALKRLHRTVVVLELNEDQTARVVDRSVVRVLPLRLRSNECREIEALL